MQTKSDIQEAEEIVHQIMLLRKPTGQIAMPAKWRRIVLIALYSRYTGAGKPRYRVKMWRG